MSSGNIQPVKKVKKGILSVIFSRVFVILASLILQLIVFVVTITRLNDYAPYIYAAFLVMGAMIVLHIINSEGNPAFKITWIMLILLTPILGTAFYLFVKAQPGTRKTRRDFGRLNQMVKPYLIQDEWICKELKDLSPANYKLASYMNSRVGFPIYRNTGVKYFPLGEDKFGEMVRRLKQAEEYIFMEYFIVEKGIMWNTILDILKEKVREGVDVRFMYDGMCSLYMLPYHYDRELRLAGIKCKQVNRVRPILSSSQNYRDHRKICVIDGKVAFTGGVNLADEYINKKERFGHWKDTAVMLEGDAVQSFTMMFLQMWDVTEKKQEDYGRYLTPKAVEIKRELGFVLPYADSPFDGNDVGRQVYLHILNHAVKYVHIMTPYLIVDDGVITALNYAAACGVEVIIILPHIPDKWFAFAVARTYYEGLIEAGVKIYEYTPGFIHAKVFVSDDDTATVGTVNLDFRSFYHHFECGAFIYRNAAVRDIERDFQETLRKSRKMTTEDVKNRSAAQKIAGSLLRLVAPLM